MGKMYRFWPHCDCDSYTHGFSSMIHVSIPSDVTGPFVLDHLGSVLWSNFLSVVA